MGYPCAICHKFGHFAPACPTTWHKAEEPPDFLYRVFFRDRGSVYVRDENIFKARSQASKYGSIVMVQWIPEET